jgi:hypothetical protein
MFFAVELALKKHCVHVLKYSIDVSMDSLPRLFNLVVISNQSINFLTSSYVCLHSSSSLDLLSSTLAHLTIVFSLHFVSNDDDMWVHDVFKLFMGSLNGVEFMGSLDGVDPCVDPYPTLFESFYIFSIVFGVEDFNVSGHVDPIFSKLKNFPFLSHFKFVPPLLHFEFVALLPHF